jgi:hypothetical protein
MEGDSTIEYRTGGRPGGVVPVNVPAHQVEMGANLSGVGRGPQVVRFGN